MARKKTEGKPDMPATEEKLRAVRLELPEDVHKLLRLEAARQDASLGELARQYVTDALKRPRRGKGEGE
jgi:predicted HicB family RNase H-like nuclease